MTVTRFNDRSRSSSGVACSSASIEQYLFSRRESQTSKRPCFISQCRNSEADRMATDGVGTEVLMLEAAVSSADAGGVGSFELNKRCAATVSEAADSTVARTRESSGERSTVSAISIEPSRFSTGGVGRNESSPNIMLLSSCLPVEASSAVAGSARPLSTTSTAELAPLTLSARAVALHTINVARPYFSLLY